MSTAAAAASTTSAGFLPSPSEFVGYVNCTLDFMAETLNQIEYLDMITFLRENIVLVLVVVYILFYIKACLSVGPFSRIIFVRPRRFRIKIDTMCIFNSIYNRSPN